MVDAPDLKSVGPQGLCRFKSDRPHQLSFPVLCDGQPKSGACVWCNPGIPAWLLRWTGHSIMYKKSGQQRGRPPAGFGVGSVSTTISPFLKMAARIFGLPLFLFFSAHIIARCGV